MLAWSEHGEQHLPWLPINFQQRQLAQGGERSRKVSDNPLVGLALLKQMQGSPGPALSEMGEGIAARYLPIQVRAHLAGDELTGGDVLLADSVESTL